MSLHTNEPERRVQLLEAAAERHMTMVAELKGPVYSPAHETQKKNELVEAAAILFKDAAAGKIDSNTVAERVNAWRPAVLWTIESR